MHDSTSYTIGYLLGHYIVWAAIAAVVLWLAWGYITGLLTLAVRGTTRVLRYLRRRS